MAWLLLKLLAAPPAAADDCLSVTTREAIVIREVVAFRPETTALVPPAEEILAAVAEVLSVDNLVDHVVINGHSDPSEGAGAYALSAARAQLVWERLVQAGVPPSRISYRGLGATPAHAAVGPLVSFDVVVVYEPERPAQPSAVDDDAVRAAVKAARAPAE